MNLSNAVAVAAGNKFSLALLTDGTMRAWGLNSSGQLGDNTTSDRHTNIVVTGLSNVVAIAAGTAHSLALLSNGTVRAWGDNSKGELGDNTSPTDHHTNVVVMGLSNVVAIAAGNNFSLALLTNGTVRAWGLNSNGQLGDGTYTQRNTNVVVSGLSNVVAIAAGSANGLALKSDGTVVIWGYTNYGLSGNFTNIPVTLQPTNHLIYWTGPSIVTQPASQTVNAGQSAIFSVSTIGAMPMAYQWYSNSVALAGSTNVVLTFINVQTNAAAGYSVVVTNSIGSVTSFVATLTVLLPPAITMQPTNLTVTAGSAATFTVAATGTAPLSYQWYGVNSGLLAHSTNAALTLTNVQTNNADSYFVTVANLGGLVTSLGATLRVNVSPVITVPPTNESVTVGNNTSFSVVATGSAPLSYQWYYNAATIGNATNAMLVLTNVQSSNAGSYSVTIVNVGGSTNSPSATLGVNPAVSVAPPAGLTNWWPAENNALDVIAGANGFLYGNTAYATGKVGQSFHFSGAYGGVSFGSTAGNFGTNDFTVEFWMRTTAVAYGEYPIINKSSACGSTNELTIRLEGQGFNNTNTSGTLVADVGQATNVTVHSTRIINDGLFHHVALVRQATNILFYIDGTFDAGGSTAGIISVTNAGNLLAGISPCIGTDGISSYFAGDLDELSIYGRALSPAQILAVYNAAGAGKIPFPPIIITQPTSQNVIATSNTTFSVSAGGDMPLSYQWYGINSGLLPNATNATLVLNNISTGNADGYFAVVTNTAGSVTSAVATLTVLTPPAIITQPANQIVLANNNAVFSPTFTGTAPLSYQWYSNSVALSGATNALLYFNTAQTNAAGSYSVVATNMFGSVTSVVASLTVVVSPTNQSTATGGNITFSVVAFGSIPLVYQWYGFNSGLLLNATNATITLNNVQTTNTDNYFAVISSSYGSLASYAATLSVINLTIDSNSDGIPDTWEIANFGTISINPNADPDGDGWSNLQEYQNGTNPNVADQPFIMIVTQPTVNSITP
jgi:Concanavalin A-like lectin/glucanases superfamily/Regulator of chromosome condensation (RCC1) repeat/Immunoglobulin domain/Immunoglobulin I-set domain